MKTATTIASMLVRLAGLILIVLGVFFWTGSALSLVTVHILTGLVFVLALWTLAIIALRAGIPARLPIITLAWGLLLPLLGLTQGQLLADSLHWIVQITHLLVGIVAIGMGEGLAGQIKQNLRPAYQGQGTHA